MPNAQKVLYAVELDITAEAKCQGYRFGAGGYWVIHAKEDDNCQVFLHVYETKREAINAAKDTDHASRIVTFTRAALGGGE